MKRYWLKGVDLLYFYTVCELTLAEVGKERIEVDSKIGLVDLPGVIRRKFKSATCFEGGANELFRTTLIENAPATGEDIGTVSAEFKDFGTVSYLICIDGVN